MLPVQAVSHIMVGRFGGHGWRLLFSAFPQTLRWYGFVTVSRAPGTGEFAYACASRSIFFLGPTTNKFHMSQVPVFVSSCWK